MKILIAPSHQQGPAICWLAIDALKNISASQNITFTEQLTDADVVICFDTELPENFNCADKKIYFGHPDIAVRQPAEFLTSAIHEAALCEQHISEPQHTKSYSVLAVTACPTGVAHTYMSAEALEAEAKKRGWNIKVETRGSVGVGNEITPEEIAQADLVIVAADIEVNVDKFTGKPMYRTSTSAALKKTAQEMDRAVKEANIFTPQNGKNSSQSSQSNEKRGVYKHLLTGVSYMLPMVVAGGLCTALSFAFGLDASNVEGSLAWALSLIGGQTALALMVPVLSGYIAYSIADRTGLTPGLVGGVLATTLGAGFLGGIISGFLAGYSAHFISTRLKLPQTMEALKPILIVPLISTLFTGLAMIYVIGHPVAWLMDWLTNWLNTMGTTNAVILGAILGAMMCTDMGGPVNKAAYAFGVGLLSSQTYAPMAAIMAAGMVPPLAMGVATLLARHKFVPAEREAGKASFVLGLCFISEGAIPFAAKDPIRVLPTCIIGGAITGALSMYFGIQLMAPHGGLFVLLIPGAINHVLMYLFAIVAGTVVSGVLYAIVKKATPKEAQQEMASIA
ncbi:MULTISPECIES: PTS fructose transporter subunit IIBC [Providencia]|uniref:PTS fructose transporter subunit IIBC n=1 Tax=Providencia TaxID=586 RepID=UPI0001C34680|nr:MULTISPECIES: PTS fructose transporter subunit IIBC [Providencia]MCG9526185.1 PTS fructose transporter subunit IIBC [Providencia rettgeri]QKG44069.1 PTS fructose transporter subunit IIBC [Providencia rettgeri]QNN34198.1 PTS fructose transporter subunit IIBC [Providencia rettgeri]QXA59108.1 PTS fructose transporter subunit IIBC [Providencia rettgeri]BBV03401.1 PTS fructose transporter subunit IIBC [Providencia rettgeri]